MYRFPLPPAIRGKEEPPDGAGTVCVLAALALLVTCVTTTGALKALTVLSVDLATWISPMPVETGGLPVVVLAVRHPMLTVWLELMTGSVVESGPATFSPVGSASVAMGNVVPASL